MSAPYYADESVTLYLGDCLDVLREMPDSSVDSVVTDPPYGLEFMGKDWDAPWKAEGAKWRAASLLPGSHSTNPTPRPQGFGTTGLPFQQWCEAWARECLRVLKPGGHLLTFGGSRTWHRLACAVEDAGFEIRDSIAWLYGCHDDHTEVLTRRGWVNGLELDDTDEVAQWATDGTVSLVKPTARQRYTYDGDLIAFRNADVDQLVTPNHRVYRQIVEREQVAGKRTSTWSDWRVDQAADVNRWQPMRLPAAGEHDGPGIGGTDYAALLGWVWAEGGFDNTGSGVRVYQSSTNQPFVDEIAALFDRLGAHKRYDYQREWKGRPYTATTWFISGELANRVRGDLPGKSPTYDLLWRMTADEKRALWDAAMKGDGSKASRAFWQQNRDDLEWAQALLAGIGCRGKIADDPRGVMHWTDRPTVELQARHLATEPVPYLGEVWCVTVPSGAFLVRRNGRVSVSGNSGFPKSLDVSKAIDKAAGAERVRIMVPTKRGNLPEQAGEIALGATGMTDVSEPITPDAARWQGWGTALKPAFEPIVVGRKPLVGTVAANVLAYGTGALNIDGCRVGDEPITQHGRGDGPNTSMSGRNYAEPSGRAWSGRWPTNVILDDSQADALDAQSGDRRSAGLFTNGSTRKTGGPAAIDIDRAGYTTAQYDDQGGASRFFPTFRYEAKAPTLERPRHGETAHPTVKPVDLMRWLVRLVTPPGGTVLDPFAGSGTTAEACVVEGFRCVLIEREATYLPLIVQRLTKPIAPVLDFGASA